ncbi:hypothetical protein H5410_031575 [Solanum commersonii]|uniref:Uncharacterized protein n=1 Tax=Solanum commersonii TaxID=4109 RepID=A0A9J5YJK2_SOLCO|nr:hypothetical protein H5410_031575 [Solanum commersonii]
MSSHHWKSIWTSYFIEVINLIATDHPSYINILNGCRVLFRQLGNPFIQHSYRKENQIVKADRVRTPFVRLKRPILDSENCNSDEIFPNNNSSRLAVMSLFVIMHIKFY